MANLNRVLLMGNLTRDPEMRHTQTGNSVVEFGLAINEKWKDKNSGEMREKTCFVDCKAWGRTGEVINAYFGKGNPIFVEGNLDFEQWDDAQSGQKRSKLKVNVTSFQFIGGNVDGKQSGGGGGQRQTQRQEHQRSFAGSADDGLGDVPF